MRVGGRLWSFRLVSGVLLAGVLAALVLVFGVGAASAVTVVNCGLPGGSAAFQAALTAGGPVSVSGTCVGTFTAPVSVVVTGSPVATLTAQGAGRTLTIGSGATVTLSNLAITGGHASGGGPAGAGGGILSFNATLTLNNCVITGNTAATAGGGIVTGTLSPVSAGMLTLNSSRVTNNVAQGLGGGGGGGILNHNGTAVLNGSVVSGNTGPGGGGIASGNGNGGLGGGGTLTITGSQISGNTANAGPEGGGGGIANGGDLTLTASSVTGNQAAGGAGGGILNHGTASISASAVSGNAAPNDSLADQGIGGGIFNGNFGVPGHGVVSITDSQVTKNTAGLGGGISSGAFQGDASVTIANTMVSFNSVSGPMSGGGGIANQSGAGNADLTITGSTMVGNLARQGLGGAIANVSQGGIATVAVASTTIGSTTPHPPYTLNPNQAAFGAGIFNWSMAGPAAAVLNPGAVIVGNKASVDGGGVYNADGATLTTSGALVLLNHPDNIVNDPNF